MLKKLSLCCAIAFLTACTSTNTVINAKSDKVASQHNYSIVNDNHHNDPELIEASDYFQKSLDKQLRKKIPAGAVIDTQIHYNIVYDKGNRALRYLVGFGAGKAKADITVTVIDTKKLNKKQLNNNTVLLRLTTEATLSIGIFGGDAKQILDNAAQDIAAKILLSNIFISQP